MASLDSLPPDQRAVLQLVLQRGRTFDEIAAMLSIDRAGVRQRALAAFDALGPQTGVAPERRGLLTDYLLGQLPPRVAADTREHLARSPGERAWARVLASELAPLAGDKLPEISTEEHAADAEPASPEPAVAPAPATPAPDRPSPATPPATDIADRAEPEAPAGQRSSRAGGAILIGLGALIAIVVVLIVLLSGGGKKKATHTTATTTPTAVPTTATSTTPTHVVAQINLTSPNGAKAPAGVAQVVKQGTNTGIIIVASGVTPNTKHDAYAVWLFKPGAQGTILGFVNPGVGTTGRLQTAGALPAGAAQYTQILVTLETQARPKTPGTIILQGNLKLS